MERDFHVHALIDHVLQNNDDFDGLVEISPVRKQADCHLQHVLERDVQISGNLTQHIGIKRFKL